MGQQDKLVLPDEAMVLVDQMIGEILTQSKALVPSQIEAILAHQESTGSRFGEAAVALGMVSSDDVLYALAKQFHYPYSPVEKHSLNAELIAATQPHSKQAEAFRAIRGQLLLKTFNATNKKKAVAVVSANKGDGKTFFAANIAVALSQLGGRTLLLDADMRGPRLHEVLGVPNNTGLSGLLSGRSAVQAIGSIPDLPSLFVLPGGSIPPNPIELIERPAFTLLLAELVSKFDYVIVDTPAAALGSDAMALSFKCGSALCIARQGNSKQAGFKQLIRSMSSSAVDLAGVIANEY